MEPHKDMFLKAFSEGLRAGKKQLVESLDRLLKKPAASSTTCPRRTSRTSWHQYGSARGSCKASYSQRSRHTISPAPQRFGSAPGAAEQARQRGHDGGHVGKPTPE